MKRLSSFRILSGCSSFDPTFTINYAGSYNILNKMSTSRFTLDTIDGLLHGSPRSFGSHLLHLTQYITDDGVRSDTIDVSDMPRVQMLKTMWETMGDNFSIFSRGKPRKSKKEVEAELNAELQEISKAESKIRETIKKYNDDIEYSEARKIDIKNSKLSPRQRGRKRLRQSTRIAGTNIEIEHKNCELENLEKRKRKNLEKRKRKNLEDRRRLLKRRRVASKS